MVAGEVRPLAVGGDRRQRLQRGGQRGRLLAGERQVHGLVDREGEEQVELLAAAGAEERLLLLRRQVHLAEQNRLARAAAHEAAQVAQELVRVLDRALRHAHGLDQEGHRVEPEAAQALLEPEARDLRDLVADGGVGDVEVGLVGVEAVQVPAPGPLVIGPVRVLLVREDHVAGLLLGLLVLPDVEVVEGRVAVARRLEPRVGARRVVGHEVGDHAEPAVARRAHEVDEVAVGPEPAVDAVEVGDVVAVVALARGVEGHEPEATRAEAGEVVDALGQALEVADAVAVLIEEGLDVEAVHDRVLPPDVAGRRAAHSAPLPVRAGAMRIRAAARACRPARRGRRARAGPRRGRRRRAPRPSAGA